MPIIEIQALPPAGEIDAASALSHVTTSVAAYLGEEPRGTWAIWRPVEPGAYAEGADAPAAQPHGTHPAIVDVFAGHREDPAGLLQEVGRAVVVRLTEADPTRVYWGE